jgi:non-specific riboncleoside hydrolase
VDDGLALIMALNSPELKIISISGVYGNTKLKNVSKNVPRLLSLFPELTSKPEYIEGASSYKDWQKKTDLPGIARMYELIKTQAPVTLVPIGPLTNIALLFHQYPDVIQYIEEMVIMGGCLNKFEFNFANDPDAADFVLNFPLPKVVCGLEVCCAQRFTKAHLKQVEARNTARSKYITSGIQGWLKFNSLFSKLGGDRGFFPFDPTAIAYLLQPDLFTLELFPISVMGKSKSRIWKFDLTNKAIIDKNRMHLADNITDNQKKSWVRWAQTIQSHEFMNLLLDRLR